MSAHPGPPAQPGPSEAGRPAPARGSTSITPASSYLDIEVTRDGMNLFERQGDGKTAVLVEALKRYGLQLFPRVSSPCG